MKRTETDRQVEITFVEDEDVQVQGSPLTPERIDDIVQSLRAKRIANLQPGGKSLTGPGVHSPTVQFRVPAEVRELAEQVAKREGVSLSKLGRDAFVDAIKRYNAG